MTTDQANAEVSDQEIEDASNKFADLEAAWLLHKEKNPLISNNNTKIIIGYNREYSLVTNVSWPNPNYEEQVKIYDTEFALWVKFATEFAEYQSYSRRIQAARHKKGLIRKRQKEQERAELGSELAGLKKAVLQKLSANELANLLKLKLESEKNNA